MMEDTGEDILRQRPSVVTTFFKRIGQVSNFFFDYSDQLHNHQITKDKEVNIPNISLNYLADLPNLAR